MKISESAKALFATAVVANSYTTPTLAVATRPGGDGYFSLESGGTNRRFLSDGALFQIFGTAANNATGTYQIVGWNTDSSGYWYPATILAAGAVTLGNIAGTASSAIPAAGFID